MVLLHFSIRTFLITVDQCGGTRRSILLKIVLNLGMIDLNLDVHMIAIRCVVFYSYSFALRLYIYMIYLVSFLYFIPSSAVHGRCDRLYNVMNCLLLQIFLSTDIHCINREFLHMTVVELHIANVCLGVSCEPKFKME